MTEKATWSENDKENDLNLWNSAKSWETRIFIEMDSACKNQQGNCHEVENSAQPFSLLFSIVV